MKKQLLTLTAIFIVFITYAQETNFDTVKIIPLKLTESVYMLKGNGGNIGVFRGEDGIMIVDDQFAPLAEKIKAAVTAIDPGQIRWLINTHIHGDHSGSNANFKKLGATIVAHENVRNHMMVEGVDKKTKEKTPARDKDAWPVVTMTDKISFHLNGDDVDVLHFGNGHTDGDVLIHFHNNNVFHAGDLYVRYGYPYIDVPGGGGINGFVLNLEKMLALMDDNSKIIPGHGELATKKDVQLFYDKIKDIRDQVAAALKKGKKPGNIPALGITKKYDVEWGKGFLTGNDFVLVVAENLVATTK